MNLMQYEFDAVYDASQVNEFDAVYLVLESEAAYLMLEFDAQLLGFQQLLL